MRQCCGAHSRRVFLAGLAATPLAACSDNVAGRRQLAFVSDRELAAMADQAWADLIAKTPVSSNPALAARAVRVGAAIVRATARTDLPWEFVVFDSPDLNAFVLPNGKVAVFRGLLDLAAHDDELAAVLGHEAAHILARHPAERVSQQMATQAGVALGARVLGGEEGEYEALAGEVLGLGAAFGVLLPYSRTHELEADRIGVDLMRKAGFDPGGALRFWEKMIARQSRMGAPLEALSTHPADSRRLAELKAAVGGPVPAAGATQAF